MLMRSAVSIGSLQPVAARAKMLALVLSALILGAHHASALDSRPKNGDAPLPMFKNPLQALEKYRQDYLAGDSASSLIALRFAANGGQPLAQWKLGSMYQTGDGVPRSDIKAYHYFSRIVGNYDEDRMDWRETSVVSSAFVALGVYSLSGIPDSDVRADPVRARDLFHYAAVYFGDPNAQYNLARMYLEGDGVKRDPSQAARWLNLAADKGHKDAEALLGNLLFKGDGPVEPQRALGLMYLTLAREAAVDPKKDAWIVNLQQAALHAATNAEKGQARRYLERYLSKAAGGRAAER